MTGSIRYLQVAPEAPGLPLLETSPFRAVVLVREAVSNEWRNRVSDWLVASGCLYMLAWGIDCSIWDDAVDWANIGEFDFKPIPPERFVMTTWHENESIEEVFWFAKNCASHPMVAIHDDMILDISTLSRMDEILSVWATAESSS